MLPLTMNVHQHLTEFGQQRLGHGPAVDAGHAAAMAAYFSGQNDYPLFILQVMGLQPGLDGCGLVGIEFEKALDAGDGFSRAHHVLAGLAAQ